MKLLVLLQEKDKYQFPLTTEPDWEAFLFAKEYLAHVNYFKQDQEVAIVTPVKYDWNVVMIDHTFAHIFHSLYWLEYKADYIKSFIHGQQPATQKYL